MNSSLLIEKRKKLGLSQKDMAEKLGYKDKSSYCLIENGKVNIRLDTMKHIQDILKFTGEEFQDIFLT